MSVQIQARQAGQRGPRLQLHERAKVKQYLGFRKSMTSYSHVSDKLHIASFNI